MKRYNRKYTLLEHSIVIEALKKHNASVPGFYYKDVVDLSTAGSIDIHCTVEDYDRMVEEAKKIVEQKKVKETLKKGEKLLANLSIPKMPSRPDRKSFEKLLKPFYEFSSFIDMPHYIAMNRMDEDDLKLLVLFHEKRKKTFQAYLTFIGEVCKKIAKDHKQENFDYLDIDEVLLVLDGKKLDFSVQEKRSAQYIYIRHEKGFEIFTENIERQKKILIGEIEMPSQNFVKGLAFGKGQVIGEVKVIRQTTPLEIIPKDKILVMAESQPFMTPMLVKARALITDEGGQLSHTSHIAREFNIPAVVGTKNATSILKDGDLVEIDIQQGTVKIITRASK